MGLDPYHGDEAARWAAVLRGVDYSFQKMMKSPLVQRWLAIMAESEVAAATARVTSAVSTLRTGSLAVVGGYTASVVVPIAAWVGMFVALGAPYAQAEAIVRNKNFVSGFTQGFVTRLLKWEWQHAVSRFGTFTPDLNSSGSAFLGYVAANARNEGLRAGFVHASLLDDGSRKALLEKLKSLTPSTRPGQWTRLDQISYVIELAAAGRRHGVFK